MEKSLLKLFFRKMRGHLGQFLSMGLLILIGVGFFVTLNTICISYESNAEKFFDSNNYADITFYGDFEQSNVEMLSKIEGIEKVQGRRVQDYKNDDITLRLISLTDNINKPWLYQGEFPKSSQECLVLKKLAQAKGIKVGDYLAIGEKTLSVTGVVASPEYVYLVQDEQTLMAQSDCFGIVFVMSEFFKTGYNEIVMMSDLSFDQVQEVARLIKATKTVTKENQINYTLYVQDLKEISTFSYIFPLVFAALIVIIVYVMFNRIIAKERQQIGVYKAIGMDSKKIIFIYVAQAGFIAFLGALLGCLAAIPLSNIVINFLSAMFEVPGLAFTFYPHLWIGIILLSLGICVLSAFLSVISVQKTLPAELLRTGIPLGGKKILLEKASFIWRWFSFNTRYAMKSAFRNKGRFLAVVLGICGSCSLLTFAFGFSNSLQYTQTHYFNDFTRYDAQIEFEPIMLTAEHPVISYIDKANKALMMPVKIDDKEYKLFVVENDFDMHNIKTSLLKDGMIIPEYYSKEWDVIIGDTVKINNADVKIAGLSKQNFGLALYTSFDYAQKTFSDFMPVYNVIFADTTDVGKLAELAQQFNFEYSTIDDAKSGFSTILQSVSTLILIMLICAVLLGLTVLYSVGLMNLSSREYEYMFMGVMGYPLKSIMMSHIKETILQLLLAIPIGFLLGFGLLNIVKTSFSGENFILEAAIFSQSYILSATIVIFLAAVMAVITAFSINKLDIVQGLKEG